MVDAERDNLIADVMLPAMEVLGAFTHSRGDPSLYWHAVQRVLADGADLGDAMAMSQLTFGLSAVAGILLDDLSAATGQDSGVILAELHRRYLDSR